VTARYFIYFRKKTVSISYTTKAVGLIAVYRCLVGLALFVQNYLHLLFASNGE